MKQSMTLRKKPMVALLMMLAGLISISPVVAAQTLTLTAATTVGAESVVPDLTWSTTPTATSCSASGAWSGAKASMGHEVLPAITSNATFTLVCNWPADQTATLSWTNPTKNTDGTNYTNAQDIIIKYRTGAGTLDNSAPPCAAPVTCLVLTPPTLTIRAINGFTSPGTVNFVAMSRNTAGVISNVAGPVSKTFTAAGSDTRAVSITVNAKPDVITGLGVL